MPDEPDATNPLSRGTDLLLAFLGGLVVALLVDHGEGLFRFVFDASSYERNYITYRPVRFWVWLAYGSLVLNVFRQVHGLYLARDPKAPFAEIFKLYKLGEQVLSFWFLLAVLSVPCAMIVYVENICGKQQGDFKATPEAMLIFLFITGLFYVAWDVFTLRRLPDTKSDSVKIEREGLKQSLQNWIGMYGVMVGLCVPGYFVCRHFGESATLGNSNWIFPNSTVFPQMLVILALGYLVADYISNWEFYFGKNTTNMKDNMKTKRRQWAAAAWISLGVLVVGITSCTKHSYVEQKKAKLQLKWIYNAGFMGDLVAKEKGFWVDEGLDVEIREGGVGIVPIKVVTTGDAEFGVATGDQVLLAIDEGTPIVALALAYQENPLAWISRAQDNIKSAADFKAKKIGLTFIDDEPLFNAMIAKAGLNPKQDVEVVPIKFDVSPFYRKEVNAFPVYRNTGGIEIAAELSNRGEETRLVGPLEEKIISYSNLYFVTDDYRKKHPEIVKAFVAGVLRGWKYAIDHPDEAAAIVAKYDKVTKSGIIPAQIKATSMLVQPTPAVKIGEMTETGWSSTQDILLKSGQLKKKLEVKSVFTDDYLP